MRHLNDLGGTNGDLNSFSSPITKEVKTVTWLKELGDGASANVWLADITFDDGVKTRCALKKFKRKHSSEYKNELNILQSIQHPHVVKLLGILPSHEGCGLALAYMIMDLFQYMDGLPDLLIQDEDTKISFAKQITLAVYYIHSKEILHRDIKMENILLDVSRKTVCLADFGVACQLLPSESYMICDSSDYGTLDWQPAEVIISKRYSYESDLYALGIFLNVIWGGLDFLPYTRCDDPRVVSAMIKYEMLPAIFPSLPNYVNSLVTQCLNPAYFLRPTASKVLISLYKKQTESHAETFIREAREATARNMSIGRA